MSLAAGCATAKRAGTGDVAFRLVWEGLSDLDLYVVDPAADCIAFHQRQAPSGGLLDVDCNAGAQSICARPIENVFWPPAAAPAGDYRFWVRVRTLIPAEAPLAFELQLLRGPRVVWRLRAVAREAGRIEGPFRYRYPDSAAPLLQPTPPDCRARGDQR